MLGGTVGQACDEDRGQHPAGGEGEEGEEGRDEDRASTLQEGRGGGARRGDL